MSWFCEVVLNWAKISLRKIEVHGLYGQDNAKISKLSSNQLYFVTTGVEQMKRNFREADESMGDRITPQMIFPQIGLALRKAYSRPNEVRPSPIFTLRGVGH